MPPPARAIRAASEFFGIDGTPGRPGPGGRGRRGPWASLGQPTCQRRYPWLDHASRRWNRGSSRGGSGGTTGSPKPWWPPEPAAAGRRPQRAARSCSTTSASPSSAASAPTSTRRTSTPSAARGLRYSNFHTTALCSPAPGPACSPGATTTSAGMGRVIDLATGFPGYDARIAVDHPDAAGDAHAARLRRLRRRQVAPHARGRDPPRAPAGTGGRWAGASSASTGSSRARPTSSCPALVHDNHRRPSRRRPTRTATT